MATNSIQNPDGTYTTYAAGYNPSPQVATTPAAQPQPAINSSLLQSQPEMQVPATPPAPDYGAALNSVPPSLESLLAPSTTPTAADNTNNDLQGRILALTQSLGGKPQAQATAEQTAGLPTFNKQLTDVNGQIQSLQKEALAIPLQLQQDSVGRGVTAGGIAPIQTGLLRNNSIKALGLSSIAQTLQGNIALAQQQANRSVDLQFAPMQAQLDTLKQAYEMNKDTLNRQDTRQSKLLEIQLAERQRVLDNAKQDKQTIIGMANAAVKNFPNDPQAQFAAQQAIQSGDLQSAYNLIGKYQADPNALKAAILDRQYKQSQIAEAEAHVREINNTIRLTQPIVATPTNAPFINAFNNAIAGMGADTVKTSTRTFSNILAGGNIDEARTYVVRTALQHAPADQQNQAIGRTQAIAAMSDIQSLLQQAAAKGANTNLVSGTLTDVANKLGTTNNPDMNYIRSRILQSLITYRKAMTGVAFGPQEAADYAKIFPDITNIEKLNTSKIQALTDSLNSNNRAVIGYLIGDQNYDALFPNQQTNTLPSNQQTSQQPSQITYQGKIYNVDAQGNMTPK